MEGFIIILFITIIAFASFLLGLWMGYTACEHDNHMKGGRKMSHYDDKESYDETVQKRAW